MQTVETFTLDTNLDQDVLLFLARQPDRNATIREAVRRYMRDEGLTLRDVLDAIESLRNPLRPTLEQPEEAVANLMGMLAAAES